MNVQIQITHPSWYDNFESTQIDVVDFLIKKIKKYRYAIIQYFVIQIIFYKGYDIKIVENF